ncbi:MAG: protease HtpX [Methylacidiphilales bacterium]|nr:protease HtpX [Candidatus Methylacidiphilales bacterium]
MRIMLFLVANILIMITLSITASILAPFFGIQLGSNSLTTLFFFGTIFGFGGAFISLALSKYFAKLSMGVKIIDRPQNSSEQFIKDTVARMAQQAGIGMPEVGVFDHQLPNAFATGMNKNNALVAVSTGLLNHLNKEEVEAVIGHEISHISNGDMVTMTLLQGLLNTFVFVLARVIGGIIDNALNKGRNQSSGRGIGYFFTVMILEILLGILASIILMWFSRRREYRADEGGARLAGTQNMINALLAIQRSTQPQAEGLPKSVAALGINGSAVAMLFRTHPTIESRVEYLKSLGNI